MLCLPFMHCGVVCDGYWIRLLLRWESMRDKEEETMNQNENEMQAANVDRNSRVAIRSVANMCIP